MPKGPLFPRSGFLVSLNNWFSVLTEYLFYSLLEGEDVVVFPVLAAEMAKPVLLPYPLKVPLPYSN